MISPGLLSHSPVARQVTVIFPSGNSPLSHWKVTCVPGIAGTEGSLMVPFCGEGSGAVQFIGEAGEIISFHTIKSLFNLRVVGGGWVSGVHSIPSGSGLHISVPSQVKITVLIADTYPSTHWIVTVDPGNLLRTGPNVPFMGSVKTRQPPERDKKRDHF